MNTDLIVLLSVFFCVCVSCHPSKPLNERSTDLTWEAWLLVDQNNRETDLGMLRRKITPKSVFIAPTFSPGSLSDSLPPCPEGYKSDFMGRCVKIFKINGQILDNHYKQVLDNLNNMFGSSSDYEEVTESTSQGPLQLNIPLFNNEEKAVENDTNVAIVVTPSSKHHHHHHHHHRHENASVKVDVKRDGDTFTVENVAAILGVKPEEIEMTTLAELSTTLAMSTTVKNEDFTTLQTTTEVGTTTESEVGTTETPSTTETGETTTLVGDALFFLRV